MLFNDSNQNLRRKISLVYSIHLWMITSKSGRLFYISFTSILEFVAISSNRLLKAKLQFGVLLSPLFFPGLPLQRGLRSNSRRSPDPSIYHCRQMIEKRKTTLAKQNLCKRPSLGNLFRNCQQFKWGFLVKEAWRL